MHWFMEGHRKGEVNTIYCNQVVQKDFGHDVRFGANTLVLTEKQNDHLIRYIFL